MRLWARTMAVTGAIAIVLLSQGVFAARYNAVATGGPEPAATAALSATPVLGAIINSPSSCTATGFTIAQTTTANLAWTDSQSAALDAAGNNLVAGYNILRATSYSGTYAAEGTVPTSLTGTPPPTTFTESPVPAPSPSAFVVNHGTSANAEVKPFSEPSTFGTSVALSNEPGAEPGAAAVSPDGASLVVAEGTSNTVDVLTISGATATLAKKITGPTSFKDLTAVAIDPVPISGLYVAFVVADEGTGTAGDVFEITLNGASSSLAATPVTIGNQGDPTSIVVTPDGTKVYVANYNSHTVSEFSATVLPATATAVALDTPATNRPIALAVTADSSHVYEADAANSAIDDITASTNTVGTSAIALTASGLTDNSGVASGDPNILAMMPNGKSLYVAEFHASEVQQVNTALAASPDTVATTTTLSGTVEPNALALSPNGCELYVSTYSTGTAGAIFPINAQSPGTTATTSISVTRVNDPNSIVVTADNQYVLDTGTGTGATEVAVITTKTDAVTVTTGTIAGSAPTSVVATPSVGYWYKVQASHILWTSNVSSPQPFSIGFNPGAWQ